MKLNTNEVCNLYEYITYNPIDTNFELIQEQSSGIGTITYVQVEGKPETRTDITDYSVW